MGGVMWLWGSEAGVNLDQPYVYINIPGIVFLDLTKPGTTFRSMVIGNRRN